MNLESGVYDRTALRLSDRPDVGVRVALTDPFLFPDSVLGTVIGLFIFLSGLYTQGFALVQWDNDTPNPRRHSPRDLYLVGA